MFRFCGREEIPHIAESPYFIGISARAGGGAESSGVSFAK
jgi:hypothetical protein